MSHVINVLAQSAGFFEIAGYLIRNTEALLKAAGVAAAVGLVIFTYLRTRAWVPTLLMLGLAGVVLWGINNTSLLETTTDQTIRAGGAGDGTGG